MPLWAKIVMAALAFVALQFHRWSRLSSGSEFSPEFPRPVVVLFNWAFGAIVLLALLQLLLDVGLLVGIVIHGGICYFVPKSQLAGPARMMLLILGGLAPFIYHSPQVTRNHVA